MGKHRYVYPDFLLPLQKVLGEMGAPDFYRSYLRRRHYCSGRSESDPVRNPPLDRRSQYIAQDCGGSIKGRRIGIFMESHKACLDNGVQKTKVYIKR